MPTLVSFFGVNLVVMSPIWAVICTVFITAFGMALGIAIGIKAFRKDIPTRMVEANARSAYPKMDTNSGYGRWEKRHP